MVIDKRRRKKKEQREEERTNPQLKGVVRDPAGNVVPQTRVDVEREKAKIATPAGGALEAIEKKKQEEQVKQEAEQEAAATFKQGKVFEEQPQELQFVTGGQGGVRGAKGELLREAQEMGLTPEEGLKYADSRSLTKGQRQSFQRLNPLEAENFEAALLKAEFAETQRSATKKLRDEIGKVAEAVSIPTRIAGFEIPGLSLVKTPKEKVEDYVREISKMSELVSAMASDGSKLDPYNTLLRLNEMDDDLSELIAKVQIQISNSEKLRANPEEIGEMQKEILDVQNEIFFARQSIAQVIDQGIQEPTGQEYYMGIERYKKIAKSI